jgi:hypothetical protein
VKWEKQRKNEWRIIADGYSLSVYDILGVHGVKFHWSINYHPYRRDQTNRVKWGYAKKISEAKAAALEAYTAMQAPASHPAQ